MIEMGRIAMTTFFFSGVVTTSQKPGFHFPRSPSGEVFLNVDASRCCPQFSRTRCVPGMVIKRGWKILETEVLWLDNHRTKWWDFPATLPEAKSMKNLIICPFNHHQNTIKKHHSTNIKHGSLNVPIEHHPTIRYMVYNGYYKVMSNIPKMGQLPTPVKPSLNTISVWKKGSNTSSCPAAQLPRFGVSTASSPALVFWPWNLGANRRCSWAHFGWKSGRVWQTGSSWKRLLFNTWMQHSDTTFGICLSGNITKMSQGDPAFQRLPLARPANAGRRGGYSMIWRNGKPFTI